ncbi:uncharacterized protein LOC121405256 [Drosophila obscura]|uniref:uncharacterized protein LOC121405256 n=1 Tax=Drosophila obscura TaxID=7282 RepID=UPI001BB0E5E1|nr:uncharacterized protein LOC121405256 [Drosophila obscura]
MVERLWEIDATPEEKHAQTNSAEQLACEEFFKANVCNLPTGRFQIPLPFKTDPVSLGSSFEVAKRRFLSLERRTLRESELRDMYLSFMKEYIELGHMSPTDNAIPPGPHYFIPHQCVLRPDSSSTKLRVVFDASSKTTTGWSLNDLLMVGPTIQRELFLSLVRFRVNRYALTADVSKMYRQVDVAVEDRNFQLIVWREHPTDQLQIFRLNTVTYGTSAAPFLAIRCLHELGVRNRDTHKKGSEVICSDFYVDDMLTGADDVDTLKSICDQVSEILGSGGFQLSKWFSNHPELMDGNNEEKSLSFNDADSTKTLGMRWSPRTDTFRYHLEDSFTNLNPTKRTILSISARLFDPLGLLSPISITAKIFLQKLWQLQLDWDEANPMLLHTSWERLKLNLCGLDKIAVPRFIARRGVPLRMYSDNGTNFVGARNELQRLQEAFEEQQSSLRTFAEEQGMEWKFIPPRAPHFGGLWEAAVKSAKLLIVRQVADAALTESEPLRSLPQGCEPDGRSSGTTFTKRWQLLSELKRRFWQAWSKDYVHNLQGRSKWQTPEANIEVGAMVVVHNDHTPPQQWITGRVTSVVVGADGKVRVAEVRTGGGVIRRPIHKLALLPIR